MEKQIDRLRKEAKEAINKKARKRSYRKFRKNIIAGEKQAKSEFNLLKAKKKSLKEKY